MSAPPVKYARFFDFTTFATLNPEKPLPGASVDTEFNRLKSTTDQTIDRLNLIQRDDGLLRDGAITTNSLADGSVTEPKLANLSVSTRTLQDGSVTGPKLAAGSIPPTALQPGSIGSTQLQDGGVQTIDLADGACTLAKLAPNSVDSSKILDASIAPSDLSPAVFSAFAPALHTHPEADVVNLIADLALKAPLASPALTGIPTAPTALVGTSTNQLATTQFVSASLSSVGAITEAPNDGALYGRQALGWQRGVAAAGDTMTGPLVVPSVKLGGITAAFPMWKRVATAFAARLADDSGDAPITSADHTPGVNIISSLGSAALRWLKVWAKDGDFSGDVNVGGNANITGILTAGGIAPASLGVVPNKNYHHNGDFKVDQRNGYQMFSVANGVFLADRYQYFCTQAGKWNFQARNAPATVGPLGLPIGTWGSFDSNGVYVSSGNDNFGFAQYYEGFDIAEFQWGCPQAKAVTLSFYVYVTVAGDYSVVCRNAPATHSFLVKFNVPVANQFYKVVINIPGPTVGVWKSDNTAAMSLYWTLDASGTNLTVPTGAWAAAVLNGATGQTKLLSSAGSGFGISCIKLELGNVATPFVPLPMGEALAKCMRYWQGDQASRTYGFWLDGGAAEYVTYLTHFPVPMRIAPAISFITIGTAGYSNSANVNVNFTPAGGTPQPGGNNYGGFARYNAISNPQGAANVYKFGQAAARIAYDAEL